MKRSEIQFILMVGLVVGCWINLLFFPNLWRLIIGPHYLDYPFLDMHCVLAHTEGHMLGWDVRRMISNPLDPLGRGTPSYPMWWYSIFGHMGLNTNHVSVVAMIMNSTFLILALLLLKPRSWVEVLAGFGAICSPGVMLAMERGNVDIILFIIVLFVPLLFEWRSRAAIPLAWFLCFFATGLKYYPVMEFALFIRKIHEIRRLCWLYFLAAVAITGYIIIYLDDLALITKTVPAPIDFYTYGAKLVFHFLKFDAGTTKIFVLLGIVIIACGSILIITKSKITLPVTSNLNVNYFILGVSIITFCFFALSNYDYRSIFLLFTFPYLFDVAKHYKVSKQIKVSARGLLILLFIYMWSETVYLFIHFVPEQRVWLIRDLTYIFVFKNGLSWIVMSLFIWVAVLLLKPDLVSKWDSLLRSIKDGASRKTAS